MTAGSALSTTTTTSGGDGSFGADPTPPLDHPLEMQEELFMLKLLRSGTTSTPRRSALAVLFAATVALPHSAAAVSPEDYDVPQSTAQQLRVGGSFAYAGSGTDVQTNDGSASLLYNRFYNSLPYAWDLSVNGVGATRRNSADEQKGSYNFVVAPSIRKYFNPEGNTFYSAEGRVTGANGTDRPAVDVTPGVGYGRFIRVTPLAQAVRIEDFLLGESVIKSRLPKETMVALAQVVERQAEYQTEHGDRYKIYWYEAMEEVIARSGQFVGKGFGAVGALRVDEVLFQEHINERFVGWDVRTGVRFELLTADSDLDRQDPGLSLRARYSRPVGWQSQFDVDLQYTSPFSGDFGADVFTATGTLNYLYELTNRVDFTVSNIVTAARTNPNVKADLAEQVRSGFIFFVENHVNLNLTGLLSKSRGDDVAQSLNLAVEYRMR